MEIYLPKSKTINVFFSTHPLPQKEKIKVIDNLPLDFAYDFFTGNNNNKEMQLAMKVQESSHIERGKKTQ